MVTDNKPFVSLVLPAYNEEAIIEDSIGRIIDYHCYPINNLDS